jgi:hypothetical protein
VDELIDTITRTSIFAGLSREDLARVAGKLVLSSLLPVAVSVPRWRAIELIG